MVRTPMALWLLIGCAAFAAALNGQVPEALYFRLNENMGKPVMNTAANGIGPIIPVITTGAPTPSWVAPGKLGASAFRFRTDCKLRTGADLSASLNSAWTVEFWIRGVDTGGTRAVCSTGDGTWMVAFANNSNQIAFMDGYPVSQVIVQSTVSVLNSIWNHVAIVFNGASTVSIYINGTLDAQSTTYAPAVTGDDFTLSNAYSSTFASPLGANDLDEFRLWKSARSMAQIGANMNIELPAASSNMILGRAGVAMPEGTTQNIYGTFISGTPSSLLFDVYNGGLANLTLSSPTFSALVNCTCNVQTAYVSPVAPGASSPITLALTPTVGGWAAFSFTMSIVNNDAGAGKSPFDITFQGNALTGGNIPDLKVIRYSVTIPDGGVDNVGSAFVPATNNQLNYEFWNRGTANLTFALPASITNQVNCTVSVFLAQANPLPTGGTSLMLHVNPLASGPFSFNYSVGNNDPGAGKNPYNWDVQGVAITSGAADMSSKRGPVSVPDGSLDSVGASFASGVSSLLTYTIFNWGGNTLTLGAPGSVFGFSNCTAVVSVSPASSVASSNSTTLVIMVTPTGPGVFTLSYSISTNDPGAGRNPYDWVISGNAAATSAPEMDVLRSSTPIADGGSDLVGTVFTAGVPQSLTYTIANTGTAALNITTLPVAAPGGLVNCTATITTQPTSPIAASASVALVVSVTPIAAGAFSCTISIDNNDANENPYNWSISGIAPAPPAPEIDVFRAATAIADGLNSDALGSVAIGVPQTVTYTINNTGNAALNLTGGGSLVVAVAVTNVSSATVTTVPSATVAASGTTSFTITYTVTGAGAFSFTLSIANNDSNENPYNWIVTGSGAAVPEMDLSRAATPIADGGVDSVGNAASGSPLNLTYSIANTGTAGLTLSGVPAVAVSGLVNCTVNIVAPPPASVAVSGSANFTLEITPTSAGAFSASLSIANNDPNENPYDWTISGTGTTSGGSGGKGKSESGGGCSTSDDTSPWLLLAGVMAALCVAARVRRRRSADNPASDALR